MSQVEEVEKAISKLSAAEIQEIANWLGNFLEDQRELRPEFLERLNRAQSELSDGECRVVNP